MHQRFVGAWLNFIYAYCRKMPACASVNVAMQLPRRFKSDYRGDSKMDAGRDLFEDAWFLVPKWKAQALVNKEIAGMKAEVTRQWMSREKELEKAAMSRENETLALKKELEKAALSREKELEKAALSRENETLALKKELEKAALSREKELEKAALSREKELDVVIARLETHLSYARTETLRTKGLLTSRGVFEFVPKRIHFERRLGKKFFAQSTCDSLDEEPPSERTEAWKLKECFEHMRKHHPDATMAKMSIGKAYSEVYGVLSQEIHGYRSAASSLQKMPLSDEARKKMAKMSSVKGAMMSAALKAKSKYDPGKGIIKTLNLWQGALTRSALELNADEKELRFLLEKLQALEGCAFTEETWRDSLASWLAMLKLYKVLKVDSGLKMMESMVSDDKLAGALGAAGGMVKLNGRLPASLLVKLNEGPATHIRTNLYKYVKRLEKDLNMISAIKEKQAAIAAVAISLTTSIGVGFATFASGLLLDMYKKGQSFKRNDILLLVGCVAALFTCVSLITMLFRKRASLQQQQTAQSPFKVKEKPKAPLLQRMSMQLTNMRTKVPKLSRRTRRRMMIVLALVAPLILFFLFFSFGDYTCITKQCISIGAVGGTNATVTESDICSPIMVGAPCADETSDGGTTGMSSDTCYQALGPFAEGVTECASWGEGKEFVTPECKTAVGSRVDAQCGSEEGDDTTDDNPNTEEEGDDTTDDD